MTDHMRVEQSMPIYPSKSNIVSASLTLDIVVPSNLGGTVCAASDLCAYVGNLQGRPTYMSAFTTDKWLRSL
jgi:hypothetical protein